MPRIDQMIQVKAISSREEGDRRKFVAEFEGPAKLFTLPDLLAEQGVLASVEKHLNKGIRCAITDYVKGGRQIMKSAATCVPPREPPRKKKVGRKNASGTSTTT